MFLCLASARKKTWQEIERPPIFLFRLTNSKSSEFHIQICLQNLVVTQRVDRNVVSATRAEAVVDLPAVYVGKIEPYCVGDHVAGLGTDAFHVQSRIEDVVIDQVRIERVLLVMLPEHIELPLILLL